MLKAQTVKRDSASIYEKVEAFCKKTKCTELIYKSLFRPIAPHSLSEKTGTVVEQPLIYLPFEGKIIRNIHIITYDPFGYDAKDTSISPHDFLPRAGNLIHLKTIPIRIRNILMIKKYDTFDSLRVKESERLIRSQSFVREVVTTCTEKNDSVDIYFRVYDTWSVIVTGAISKTGFTIDLKDKNILGTGHQFQNTFKQNYVTGQNSYSSNYYIPNIYNTFINSTIHYNIDESRNYFESAALNRSFYSALTEWAGGISFQQQFNRQDMLNFDSTHFTQTFKSNTQDYWLGRSWKILKGHSEMQNATHLIASARYLRVHYLERADERFDSLHTHPQQQFYLASIGISQRQYKQDNYIFRYGYTEDVPVGQAYSLVGGYQTKDNISRWYMGSRIYTANYYKWGYFNLYMEYGTFLNHSQFEEGSFVSGINYFSELFRIGRWKLRQFIKPQYTFGHDRLISDNLSLNSDAGIKGFNSVGLKGTEKMVFTFQLQSYAPWKFIGFQFGPYIICSFGMLGTEKSGFHRSPLYSSFGFGLLIKNEYLVLNTFQISLAYYPFIPGYKNNVLKFDPIKTTDFGFRDFDISEPSQISYQ
ncbi:MAG: hypothetical protein ACXVDZ_06750 [Bacteroidia bacterium]